MMDRVEDGRIVAISGMTGSGKTSFCVQEVRGFDRVVAWDPDDELWKRLGAVRVTSAAALVEQLRSAGGGALRVALVARNMGRKHLLPLFSLWARAAFAWGVDYGPCAVVADELADVSNAGKAPDGWGQVIRRGRKHGIHTFAVSQRWAEADKTTLGNAAAVVCFRANGALEADYLAQRFRGCTSQELQDLPMLRYVELNRVTGARFDGVVDPKKEGAKRKKGGR
jgi:hypothetical protein